MCPRTLIAVALALTFHTADSITIHQQQAANPIRKVVMMLQNMQAKVMAEGKKEEELFDKFMCYCKRGRGDLEASISAAKNKIDATSKAYEAAVAKKAQTEQDAESHKADRAAAKDAMAKATAMRKEEAAAFAKESSDLKQNIEALGKAIAAIEKGAAGSFLQTASANMIKQYAIEKSNLPDFTRNELLSFLSGAQGYNPQSGEITGILKTMHDEMSADLKSAEDTEAAAIKNYEDLMAAKKKEVTALSAQIEAELTRIGELGVEIANMGNDVEATQEALAADEKFLEDLEKGCKTKAAEWQEIKKTRAEELVALADTIKVLNDDDALELFKKTLPGAGSSFVQMQTSSASMRAQALAIIRAAAQKGSPRPKLDLIALALSGKPEGFDKIVGMIDEMVANLKQEQKDDDAKKDYCNKEFDSTDDKKKGLEIAISDSEVAIEELEGSIANLADEIKALQAGIKALDKSVAEATEQRKADNAEYKELMASDAAAKEVLQFAKNRLNKFYNPKMYIAPPKRDLTEQDSIVVNMGGTLAPTNPPAGIAGTGIEAFMQKAAPPPPPETFDGYHKKSQESTGVIAMIDLLVKDLDKEMQVADVNEKDAQKDYETLMAQAAAKRAEDSKASTNKAAAKAEEEEMLGAEKDKKEKTTQELMNVMEEIKNLHGECDWLVKYWEARKEARTGEIESLGKARAVLSGADFS